MAKPTLSNWVEIKSGQPLPTIPVLAYSEEFDEYLFGVISYEGSTIECRRVDTFSEELPDIVIWDISHYLEV